ncbi:restriction endonuclease subunit S [Ligilactobacillus salivarius]|uniref:restriction endonuclease subunit S n=2 Tax=Ligilactobacillus salivarius TaxID=1624 RepID=UPI0009D9EB23|nr:restriction endonuclease subunit S [Ligilactobacillus salivarius]OQQ95827.1 hypothetical protein B6U51_09085 [Ligilactobacillus salivarius]OQR00297.1 hypothetical protein B6U50_09090 [Ligilactobacillus salivarius]
MRYSKISESLYIKGRIGWKGLKKKEYLQEGSYRIINGSNIVDNKIDWSNCGYISKERYDESEEIKLKEGDILITKDGTIGKVAMVNKLDKPSTVASGLFILRNINLKKWDTLYLFYYLQSFKFKEFIYSRTSGSVIPHLYQRDFEELMIPELSLKQQKQISQKIHSIQQKIDLNNKINTNLEKISTEFFLNWLSNTHNDKKKSLDSIANYKNGLAMQKFRPVNIKESLPVVKIRELNQGHTDSNSDLCRKDIDESVQINTGDIIFSWSGTLLLDLWAGNEAGLNQHLFKVTSNDYPSWFIYEWTKYYLQEFQLIAKSKATTMGHIKRSNLKESFAIIPDDDELTKLNNLLGPIFDNKIKIRKQNLILRQIKKQLLAKLLN